MPCYQLAGGLYKPGDCVIIKQEDPNGPTSVAELLGVYQYLDSDEMMMVIRWYHRIEDLEIRKKDLPSVVDNEVKAAPCCDAKQGEKGEGEGGAV